MKLIRQSLPFIIPLVIITLLLLWLFEYATEAPESAGMAAAAIVDTVSTGNLDDSVVFSNPCTLNHVVCAFRPQSGSGVIEGSARGVAPQPLNLLEVSAYNLVEWQTDDTPCVGAAGIDQCTTDPNRYKADYFLASNGYEMWTLLEIEGVGTGVVVDRMHSRYTDRIDICMGQDIERAINFGVKLLSVKEI